MEWMVNVSYIYTSTYLYVYVCGFHMLWLFWLSPPKAIYGQNWNAFEAISPVLVSRFILIGAERVRISVFRLFGEI